MKKVEKSSNKTILDKDNIESKKTVLDSDIEVSSNLALSEFREYSIIEEFEAIGAEADVFIVKKDEKEYFLKLYRRGIKLNESVLESIKVLSHSHKYFAKLFEYGFDEKLRRYYEISEYISFGSIEDAPKEKLDIKLFVQSLNEALHLLHERKIIHRDLKPSNILLRSESPMMIVLVDFGVSSVIEENMTKVLTTLKGTYAYTAPEVMSGYIGKEVDYWSFGMILLELLDKNPLNDLDAAVVLNTLATQEIQIPSLLDARMQLLLQGLLTRDSKLRWGYKEVNEWLQEKTPAIYRKHQTGGESDITKYKFKNMEYTKHELAKVFVRAENFEDALKHIGRGYITRYLEKLEEFDEAIALDEYDTPIEKLVYFIYSQETSLPFSLYGVVIGEDYMFGLLLQFVQDTITETDRKILELHKTGQLKKLYKIYENISGLPHTDHSFIDKLPNEDEKIFEFLDLSDAIIKGDMERILLLTEHMDSVDQSYIYDAVKKGNKEIVHLIIKRVSDKLNEENITLLYENGYSKYIKGDQLKRISKYANSKMKKNVGNLEIRYLSESELLRMVNGEPEKKSIVIEWVLKAIVIILLGAFAHFING